MSIAGQHRAADAQTDTGRDNTRGADAGSAADHAQLRFQALVVRLLNLLLRTSPAELDGAIERVIADLGEACGSDRTYVFQLRNAELMDNTHEWVSPGTEPMIAQLQGMDTAMLAPWRRNFDAGREVYVPDVADLPDDDPVKETLEMQDIKSLLAVPMNNAGQFVGFVGFDAVRAHRRFSDGEVLLLRSVADMINTVIQRRQALEAVDKATQRSRQLESDLRATLDAIPDLVVELDADGVIQGVHSAALAEFFVDPVTLVGKSLEDALPPRRAEMVRGVMKAVDRHGRSQGHQFRWDRGDEPGWYELSASARASVGKGTRNSYVLVIRNITARMMAEREARRRRTMLAAMFQRSPSAIALVDLDDGARILDVNRALLENSGFSRDHVIGAPVAMFTTPASRDRAAELIAALRTDTYLDPQLMHFTHADGREVPIKVRGVRYTDEDGRALAWIFAEDLSEQLEYEAALASRTDEAVRAREQLVNAVESLPDAFAYFDKDLTLVLRNRSRVSLIPGDEAIFQLGRHFEDVLRDLVNTGYLLPARGREDEFVARTMADLDRPRMETEMPLADGRWYRLMRVRTPDGGLVSMLSDITELKTAHQRLEAVIEGAQVGTWEWDMSASENRINARWAEMLGYTLDDLAPMRFDQFRALVHPGDLRIVEKELDEVFTGERKQFSHEMRLRHRKGHWVHVLTKGRISRVGPNGAPLAMAGIHLDMTRERLQAEALVRTNAELKAALERQRLAEKRFFDVESVSSDWFWEMDADLRFSYLSPSLEKITGLRIAEQIGKTITERVDEVPGARHQGDWAWLESRLASHSAFRDFVYQTISPDGKTRWLRLSGSPWFDEQEKFGGFRGVGTDVTALVEAKERAEESNRAKTAFLANMSHEIRTPLNGVLGMAELLSEELSDPWHQEMLESIRDSGRSLLSILNDLLDMAKIEAGKMALDLAPLEPRALVARLEPIYAELARRKALVFEVIEGEGSGGARLGDALRLQQILHNLLSNAIKFTETGHVRLHYAAPPGKPLVIEVADSGIGMSEEALKRVFEPFEQADGSTTRRFGGTGLGMPILQNLIRMMGGTLRAESTPGEGTTFRVDLPLDEVAPTQPVATADSGQEVPVQAALPLGGLRLLAADDHATNRMLLQMMLTRAGAEVEMVNDGRAALAAWSEAPEDYDLVLLDIAMPQMDGITALRHIRTVAVDRALPRPRAVAITANAMPDQVDELRRAGFDAHVAKPFHAAVLVRELLRLCPAPEGGRPGPPPRGRGGGAGGGGARPPGGAGGGGGGGGG
ncbi:MAG: PAS domain S-box protein, partial [Rhodobacteraceae bacterium]|nr:PAS domain S-box protein [Paracoccaceae bacterium]